MTDSSIPYATQLRKRKKSTRAIKNVLKKYDCSKPTKPLPFVKREASLIQVLGSDKAAILFSALEYRFTHMPKGFYKFKAPCNSPYYKPGDSWCEELSIGRKALWNASKIICTHYNSKTSYQQAVDKLGDGVFHGKPYVSYHDNQTHVTFYYRNELIVKEIMDGSWNASCIKNTNKGNMLHVSQKKHATCFERKHATCFERKHATASKPAESKAEQPLKNTLQRKPISLSLSRVSDAVEKQPKEEIKKLGDINTKQPAVPLTVIDSMVLSWRRIVCRDLDIPISRDLYANLEEAFTSMFSSDIGRWEQFCLLCASSKYLMGETAQKFKLNLAWACKRDSIVKITEGHFSTGDRINMIHLDLPPISDTDPVIKDFKLKCLDQLGKARYISWIKPLMVTKSANGIACTAPTKWFANHIAQNDYLGLAVIISKMGIAEVTIKDPAGNTISTLGPK